MKKNTYISTTNKEVFMNISAYNHLEKLERIWLPIKAPERKESLYGLFTRSLGALIRDTFFTPLFRKLSSKQLAILEEEEAFVANFWKLDAPTHYEIPYHDAIRNHFTRKYDTISVDIEGEKISATCLVIESKKETFQDNESLPYYNLFYLLGNLSTIDNDTMGIHPYLTSYLEDLEKNPETTPPARFILLSQYNTVKKEAPGTLYKPDTMPRAGFITAEIIKEMTSRYGVINQVIGHSLGCIVLASSLKYLLRDPSDLPKNFLFDRGPSSIQQLSRRILGKTFHVASLFFFLEGVQNWMPNLGEQINHFVEELLHIKKSLPCIVISGCPKEHIFPQESNLCFSPFIQELHKKKQIVLLPFSPPSQCIPHDFLHISGNNRFTKHHLLEGYKDQSFLQEETLEKAILRQSLIRV